ncbi:MAG TPA: cell wall hydrolase [Gammaproteobacteria bacterium]
MRALLENWRYSISFAWHCLDKGAVVFYSLLPLPFVFLGALGYSLTHEHRANLLAAAVASQEAASREAAGREAELVCLAENVYYESRGEPLEGQYAVAEVTMNRVGAGQFPSSVCEVVHEKRWDPLRKRFVGAFSWTELERLPRPRGPAWDRARAVAEAVYDHEAAPRVDGALYYHAEHLEPSWAKEKRLVAEIGRHRFYR